MVRHETSNNNCSDTGKVEHLGKMFDTAGCAIILRKNLKRPQALSVTLISPLSSGWAQLRDEKYCFLGRAVSPAGCQLHVPTLSYLVYLCPIPS